MLGATEQELKELAVVVADRIFWSNILPYTDYSYPNANWYL